MTDFENDKKLNYKEVSNYLKEFIYSDSKKCNKYQDKYENKI